MSALDHETTSLVGYLPVSLRSHKNFGGALCKHAQILLGLSLPFLAATIHLLQIEHLKLKEPAYSNHMTDSYLSVKVNKAAPQCKTWMSLLSKSLPKKCLPSSSV